MDQYDEKYSLGTAPLFKKLYELIPQRDCPVEVVFINAETLMRNSSSKESVGEARELDKRRGTETTKPASVLAKESWTEISNFCSDICQLMNENSMLINPTVILYLADYKKGIPTELQRPETESKKLLNLCKSMLSNYFVKHRTESNINKVKFVQIPIGSHFPPYQMLVRELAAIKNNHNAIMITHHPLDYHIFRYCATLRLLSSFTGDILTPKELGKKVFKEENIPFTEDTHALLGDSVDFKGSLAIGQKRQLFETARNEHWKVKTREYIKDKLRSLSIKIPFNI